MNLKLKIFCVALVLLETCGDIIGLRFEQLVKFSCEICKPDPDDCCVGTVIHKDVILTTSYCATSCQSIHKYDRNIEIINTFKQPRMEAKTRHDIALAIINIDWKLNSVASLSSTDPLSSMGLKAYFPFMEDGNTRMREIVISACGKQDQNIYSNHVCGSKDMTRTTRKCFQRQGVPLLLAGNIIAITAGTNNKLCNDEQIVFHTISPELPWIKSTINELYPLEVIGLTSHTGPTWTPDAFRAATETTMFSTIMFSTTQTSPSTPSTTETTPTTETSTTPPAVLDVMPISMPNYEENLIDNEERTENVTEPGANIISTQKTNAMDWFNQKVRNKLKSGNHSYFVLTTTKRVYTTPFVDLTV